MYEIVLESRAKRELDRVPKEPYARIDAAIWSLRGNPRPHGVQKLSGDLYRIRSGDWRILFTIQDATFRVVVLRVVRRSESTYKHLS